MSKVFFFSSRRRHTMFDCDWSSDVCSSDLRPCASPITGQARRRQSGYGTPRGRRSEERRVGKECRSRWSTKNYKKKCLEHSSMTGLHMSHILFRVEILL